MSSKPFPGGLAWMLSLKDLGSGLKIVESPAVTIATSPPTQILLNNPDRVFWLVMNLSPYYGVMAFNAQVTLTKGFIVSGLGGFATAVVTEDGETTTYPVWAVESQAGQTFYVLEIVRP